jgi:hypothetical protein
MYRQLIHNKLNTKVLLVGFTVLNSLHVFVPVRPLSGQAVANIQRNAAKFSVNRIVFNKKKMRVWMVLE